ncbi:MAG: cupin domain-containing protein [Flavobacteriaceae bacterium]|nr:cupin domain-containing protein [Flavobacteriaceae bacterium]
MERKTFLKASVFGLGAALVPGFASCRLEASENNKVSELTQDTMVPTMPPKIIRESEGTHMNVIGDNQILKLSGKDTNGLFTLIEENNDPGIGIPLHVHENEDEIFHVLEGQLEVTIGDSTTILNSGDIGFLPRKIPHAWKVIGDTPTKVLLSIFPAGLEEMFAELSKLEPGPPDLDRVAEITNKYQIQFV